MRKIITCESVNKGHPDKTCDLIADTILDEALRQDPNSQMAVEAAIKDDLLMIYGEATTKAELNYVLIAKAVLAEVGYTRPFRIILQISEQSKDIAKAVKRDELAAGDQGIVYGYATSETPERLPLPLVIATKLMRQYERFRQSTAGFHSDAKSQVSIEYENDKPNEIATVLISASHTDKMKNEEIYALITAEVISPVLAEYADLIGENTQLLVNPSGRFVNWGSYADSGCTGRKTAVDTYGGVARHGGGAFSSKSPQKMDRSAAYFARYAARNVIENDMADRCEISVSYGIGLAAPISLSIETFGTEKVQLEKIQQYVEENFNFCPANIIKELDLARPIYRETACFGHFGRPNFPWEQRKEAKCNLKK